MATIREVVVEGDLVVLGGDFQGEISKYNVLGASHGLLVGTADLFTTIDIQTIKIAMYIV